MLTKATAFLRNKTGYIKSMVENFGYESCHIIENKNASSCARKCDESAKNDFAERCKKDKGVFKCCIRYLIVKRD